MLNRLASSLQRLPERSRTVAAICVYGLSGGLVAVAFQVVINWIYGWGYVGMLEKHPQWFPWTSLALICTVSVISGWLLTKFSPDAAGSGIPQLKLAFWKDFGQTPARLPWVKFVASALSIGGGHSLGREGPSVQLGGSVASSVAGWLGVAKQNRRTAAATGAAAGLAAAFNSPLAAVAFVLEEILEDLNSRLMGPVLLAAVIGAFVVHAFLSAQPAFELPRIDEPTWRAYLLMPISAALAGLAGAAFQSGALALRMSSRKWKALPPIWRPLLGGLVTWMLGMLVFSLTGRLGVFALGYDDLSQALNGGLAWKVALLLLVAKLIATISCYGLGGAGGIFSPSLFFGGMCGVVVAGLGGHFLSLRDADMLLLVVGGMSACLGAVVQAPVTAVLIIFEMTHQFALVPGLMLAVLISQMVVRRFHHANFYEVVLSQDGHHMAHVIPPRDLRSWQELPVSAIAQFDPQILEGTDNEAVSAMLEKAPHQRFPVTEGGKLGGILLRSEFRLAQSEQRPVHLLPAVTVRPGQTVRECQRSLIESHCGMVIITDHPQGVPLAVVTLHDLLRAQAAISEREG